MMGGDELHRSPPPGGGVVSFLRPRITENTKETVRLCNTLNYNYKSFSASVTWGVEKGAFASVNHFQRVGKLMKVDSQGCVMQKRPLMV